MLSLLLPVVVSGFVAAGQGGLERVGGLDPKLIPEASGIVKSRRFPDTFWVHNDSGNPPDLFAIRGDGRIIREFRLAIPNVDWEDIAIDDDGHLYLGDIGNNTRAIPVRAVYRIDEPDPNSSSHKPVAASSVTFYAFPQGKRFDAESLWCDSRTLMLLTKVLDGREPELFAISLDSPSTLFRPTLARTLGPLTGFSEPATGADLNADGTLLAVCSTAVTRVYRCDRPDSHAWRLLATVRYDRPRSVEGIAWAGSDLYLVAEGDGIYRLAEKQWRAGSIPKPGARRSLDPKPASIRPKSATATDARQR